MLSKNELLAIAFHCYVTAITVIKVIGKGLRSELLFFLTSKNHQDIDNDSVDSGDDNITCWIESADQCKATSRQI